MLRQVPFEDLGYVDFIPQAVIRVPVRYFSDQLGYKFQHDTDDLDEYESSFFKLEDVLPFALVHYRGQSEDTTTIYFARATNELSVAEIVEHILGDFGLTNNAIAWISSGLPSPPTVGRPILGGTRKRQTG